VDRAGIFVDAGYVYAAGGEMCCGTRSRGSIALDVAGFVVMLESLVGADSALPILRTYWYDGARDRIPSAAHLKVAALARVKLRLGHLNSRHEQKGVDALIYRDLMTLARERAIADAYLLSGDEDLREGVTAAQDMGVRITLLGIPPKTQRYNQSRDLVHEADNVLLLDESRIGPYFSLPARPSEPPLWNVGEDAVDPVVKTVESVGRDYARDWWDRATSAEKRALVAARPRIPATLDADLLTSARRQVSPVGEKEVRSMRRAFWDEVSRVVNAELPDNPPR
jgi:uncharacterized LabA/DUF88 family protein